MERKKKSLGFATGTESGRAHRPKEKKTLQENQSRQETVATVLKKGKRIDSFGCCRRKGKPRSLENNLIRSNSTKLKKRNTNTMQNPIFPLKPTKLYQIHGVHHPPSLI
jgi:hypothetical protein